MPVMSTGLFLRFAWLLTIWGLGIQAAAASDWQVTGLELKGVSATSPETAVALKLKPNATAPWIERRHQLNDRVPEGSRLRVPADVQLQLSSPQSVRVSKMYGSEGEVVLKTANAERNVFAVLAGAWLFAVEKRLDTVSVSAGRGQALSRNTAFTIAVDPQTREASFKVQNGTIDVWHDQTLQVGDRVLATTPVRHTLNAGDPALVLVDTADDYLVNYGTFDEAESAFEARARTAREAGDTNGQFNALLALGDVLRAARRGPEALSRYDEAVGLAQGPADNYWRALLQGRRGDALVVMNRFSEAAEAYRQSMSAHGLAAPREDEDPVTDQRGNLVSTYFADGVYRCAEAQADEVLRALDARTATRFHPSRAAMWTVRGAAALESGRPVEARQAYRRALELWRRIGFPKTQADGQIITEELAAALIGAGETHLRAGQLADADAALREARAIAERLFTTPHGLQADARVHQADVMSVRGRQADALALADEAIAILDAAPPDELRRGDALATRGEVLLRQGRTADAVEAFRKARTLWQSVWPGEDHPRFQRLSPDLARALRARGAPGAAAEAGVVEAAARKGARLLAQRERDCLR